MNFKSILFAALLGAAGGFGGSYYFMVKETSALHDRLALTPPVVVVDFTKVASSYPSGADEAEIEELMIKTNNAIFKLKEAGYLIIDGAAILGAPEDIYLPSEIILE